jgi:hypothetical protein
VLYIALFAVITELALTSIIGSKTKKNRELP